MKKYLFTTAVFAAKDIWKPSFSQIDIHLEKYLDKQAFNLPEEVGQSTCKIFNSDNKYDLEIRTITRIE